MIETVVVAVTQSAHVSTLTKTVDGQLVKATTSLAAHTVMLTETRTITAPGVTMVETHVVAVTQPAQVSTLTKTINGQIVKTVTSIAAHISMATETRTITNTLVLGNAGSPGGAGGKGGNGGVGGKQLSYPSRRE